MRHPTALRNLMENSTCRYARELPALSELIMGSFRADRINIIICRRLIRLRCIIHENIFGLTLRTVRLQPDGDSRFLVALNEFPEVTSVLAIKRVLKTLRDRVRKLGRDEVSSHLAPCP